MHRKLKGLFVVGIVGVAAYAAGSVLATPPSGLVNVPLARGTNVSDGTIPLQVGTDVAMAQITVDPGGSSGWHSHPGGAIIVVKTGTLTVYESVGSRCETTTYSAGQAFVERLAILHSPWRSSGHVREPARWSQRSRAEVTSDSPPASAWPFG